MNALLEPSPARILMTTDTVGGVWNYALELARALEARGVEVILATMGAPLRPDQRRELAMLGNVEAHESAFKLEWMNDPWDDLDRAAEWLLELEQRFTPDLVHLNGYAHGALAWQAPVLVVGHSCVLSWWRAVHNRPAPPEWARYAEVVRAGLQAADAVVAPSNAMLRSLQEHYGPLHQARVVHNGTVPARFRSGPKQPLVLGVGRLWDEAKNAHALATIARDLPWPVTLAGDACSPDGQRVQLPNVALPGQLPAEKLTALYAQAAIFAAPARYEPFGLSILEAALSGCALVLGNIASLRELWEGAALFVRSDDPEHLLRELRLLIACPAERTRLALAARRQALTFTAERMADHTLDVYRGLLSTPRSPRHPALSFA